MGQTEAGRWYIAWIAWRNILPKHRRGGLSFMTIVSILGVAIGVAALIIVLSVMGGFEQDLRNKMLRGQPHLEVMHKNAVRGFALQELPVAGFRELVPEATQIEPFTQADVVLKQKKHLTSAVLFGVPPSREGQIWGFDGAMIQGDWGNLTAVSENKGDPASLSKPGIILGEQLAEQLGADIGDEIEVLSPQASASTAMEGGTVARSYVVGGIFRTGLFNYDAKWAVVALPEGRKFMADYDTSLDQDQYVSGIAINVPDPTKIDDVVRRIEATGGLKDLDFVTWQKANKSLLFALKLEKFAMGSILMLIVVVAAFSISGTLMMTVFHKRGQVSLLRSLGMNQRDICHLYLLHGFFIGTVGIILGAGFGIGVCALIKSFHLISLPQSIYHLKSLPCRWLWWDYVVIAGAAWVFSLVASLYPAMTAARHDPGQGLRYL